jgi:hypothetical protein
VFHDSSIGVVDFLLGLTVGMNASDAIFVFGTVSDPLGRTFAHSL